MKFTEISIAEFKNKQKQPNLYIIDVREEYEFEDFNIGGVNIPMHQILSRTSEFENQEELFLICSSGKRSKTVAYHLSQQFDNKVIYTICGGITQYQVQ